MCKRGLSRFAIATTDDPSSCPPTATYSVCPAGPQYVVDAEACQCKECIIKLGCPAILSVDGKAWIDNTLCHGCDLCLQVCRFDAIHRLSPAEAAA